MMDICKRSVVLAKGGDRDTYRPVSDSSNVCNSSNPVEMVESFSPGTLLCRPNVLHGKGLSK